MKKYLFLFAIFVLVVFALGCLGAKKEEKNDTNTTEIIKDQPQTAEENERPTYLCPLDQSKMNYDCEIDNDCKMITCRSGAGDVNTCVGDTTEYEGASSTECKCKVVGSYQTTDTEGKTTTVETKNCRHI